MQAHLSPAVIESILTAVDKIRLGQAVNDRHFPHGLGCGPSWPLNSGSVERSSSFIKHK